MSSTGPTEEPIDVAFDDVIVSHTVVSPIESLVDAFSTEKRLLDELISVMRRQRDAVGQDDLQAVDDTVFATHRVLVTLGESRRRRRTLNTLIGHSEDLGIHGLDKALGARMTPALRIARDDLHDAARSLAREVSLNRRILREALACGDAFARMLAGAEASPIYAGAQSATPPTRAQSNSLLDRRI